MIPVSVVIVTKNEEKNIREALESIKKVSEIVIVDSFSTDRTLEICREYTDRIYQSQWLGYARQKQKAVELAKGPWVYILDSDERFTESLWNEIEQALKNSGGCSGYYVPRKNYFLGKWMRHGGWWPDYTLRFFLKDRAQVEDRKVHEKVVVNGKAGYLKNPLEHYTYRTLSDYIKKMDIYSTLSAEELIEQGADPGKITLIVNPLFTFLKMFFLRAGFMDGIHGLILATLYSHYTFLKYSKVWEKKEKG
jgi:glycosyltransferase involved in cell wall biosynthesis